MPIPNVKDFSSYKLQKIKGIMGDSKVVGHCKVVWDQASSLLVWSTPQKHPGTLGYHTEYIQHHRSKVLRTVGILITRTSCLAKGY